MRKSSYPNRIGRYSTRHSRYWQQISEGQILQRLGWEIPGDYGYEVVISEELIEQISRVAKRLKNKDWAGEIIGRIWQKLKVRYVQIDDQKEKGSRFP